MKFVRGFMESNKQMWSSCKEEKKSLVDIIVLRFSIGKETFELTSFLFSVSYFFCHLDMESKRKQKASILRKI